MKTDTGPVVMTTAPSQVDTPREALIKDTSFDEDKASDDGQCDFR